MKAQWDRGDRNVVRDWSDLEERMAYVFRLFLHNQRLALWSEAPFDDAQLADLGRLVVPHPVEVGGATERRAGRRARRDGSQPAREAPGR